jgi:hypothetical protein
VLSIFLQIIWWLVLAATFAMTWVVDIPTKLDEFLHPGNGHPVSTYNRVGRIRLSGDRSQDEVILEMYEREYELEMLKENHIHDISKIRLSNELEAAKLEFALVQESNKRAYHLSLFRWACMVVMMLTGGCQYFNYLDKKDLRRDNRFYLGKEESAI